MYWVFVFLKNVIISNEILYEYGYDIRFFLVFIYFILFFCLV